MAPVFSLVLDRDVDASLALLLLAYSGCFRFLDEASEGRIFVLRWDPIFVVRVKRHKAA